MRVNIFIVHEEAREVALAPKQPGGAPCKRFQWTAVARSQCKKGCQARWQLVCAAKCPLLGDREREGCIASAVLGTLRTQSRPSAPPARCPFFALSHRHRHAGLPSTVLRYQAAAA